MSIQIKVAFCTECRGYHSATPSDKKNINHADVTDHFFYHGEPFFTLDSATFDKASKLENTEVITMSLEEHIKHDHLYCYCDKKTAISKNNYYYESLEPATEVLMSEKWSDTDYYFKDLYYTYNNFHGLVAGNHNNYNSSRP